MTIIVEDGTIVPNANSYASVAQFKSYAELRGLTVPEDSKIESSLIVAMDKIGTYRRRFSGTPIKLAPLAWPRNNAWVDGEQFSNDAIPVELVNAQIIYAFAASQGISLFTNSIATDVKLKRKKIDVLEWEYAVPEGDNIFYNAQPIIYEADDLMESLTGSGGYNTSINSPVVRA